MPKEPNDDPKFIAQQLRRPEGEFASYLAEKMDEGNKPLFDLTLTTMDLEDGEDILEIGFGSGSFIKSLFNSARLSRICGIDYSEEMVKSAIAANKDIIKEGKLDLQNGSSESLPFRDEEFDKVFCNNVIYFWEEPENHLSEVLRVLKPGGRFYAGIRSKESMEVLPFTDYGFRLYSREEWSKMLEAMGFKYVMTTSRLDKPFEFEGETLQLESMCVVGEKPA